jgi:hypothetical protein
VPRGAAAAPIIPICVPGRVIAEELPAIHIGGYRLSSGTQRKLQSVT